MRHNFEYVVIDRNVTFLRLSSIDGYELIRSNWKVSPSGTFTEFMSSLRQKEKMDIDVTGGLFVGKHQGGVDVVDGTFTRVVGKRRTYGSILLIDDGR